MLSGKINSENSIKEYISFTCPICKRNGIFKIQKPITKALGFFIVVLISKGDICPHEFLAYIDNNRDIRGYQKIDYSLAELEFRMVDC